MSSNESISKALSLYVRVCMRRKPLAISSSEPVSGLMFRMINDNMGSVIVVEEDKPIGIITEKDVLERVVMRNKNVYRTLAKDVMSKPIISIEADCSVKEALALMQMHKIRRLAVTENGVLIGMVTQRRLLEGVLGQIY